MGSANLDTGSFTYLFPEWVLSWSLQKAMKNEQNIRSFWEIARYYPSTDSASGQSFPLREFFPGPTFPPLQAERAFVKNEATYFGIEETEYQKSFWSSRPDFVAESEGASVFLIFEAKGGKIDAKVWNNPKELGYYRFLKACTTRKVKGFFYIVPHQSLARSIECLKGQFEKDSLITTGVLIWEELLSLIYNQLLETVIDQVLNEMEGLRHLRHWNSSFKSAKGKTANNDSA